MTTNESSTASNSTSWIISIAVSVVCCAVIFIVFASYITDVKNSVRESFELINSMQAREVAIQQTLEIINKRLSAVNASAPLAAAPAAATSSALTAPAGTPVAEPIAPAAPAITAPTIQVPGITAPAPASAAVPVAPNPSTSK